ncbi:PAS domain-containing sensor histidine kinase [Sphingomonas sp. IC081]|nr:PAS domain-containing sensor histidine kinase [Sphingomonas sp. IC081]
MCPPAHFKGGTRPAALPDVAMDRTGGYCAGITTKLKGKPLFRSDRSIGLTALVSALVVLSLDIASPLQGAVAVLYTSTVLIASWSNRPAATLLAGASCSLLAMLGFWYSHWDEPFGSPAMRLGVALFAIGMITMLSIRHRSARDTLSEQARMLELTHDTVVVRGMDDTIRYWNEGAERLYGWTRAEAVARRRSEERYHTIFHAAGLPMMEIDLSAAKTTMEQAETLDLDGINRVAARSLVRDANAAAIQLFGVSAPDKLIGHSLLRFHTPAAERSLGRLLGALAAGQRDIEEEAQFLTETGAIVDVVLRLTVLEDDNNWSRLLILAIDVTERYRMQRRLAQAQSELTEVNRATTLGQVAAFIAHEINQPLTAISAFASSGKRWLAREAPDAAEVADCLEKIALSGARAADVVARVRRLFRKGEAEQSELDLASLIRETASLLDRELRESAVTLHLDLPPDLPPVTGDRILLQQVLVNLILNAGKAMTMVPDGPRDLRIDAFRTADSIAVDVADSGTGILSDPQTIFEPFFSSREDGMGIGLSISRSIVEQHGGAISAANREEGGARFRFSIPITPAHEPA